MLTLSTDRDRHSTCFDPRECSKILEPSSNLLLWERDLAEPIREYAHFLAETPHWSGKDGSLPDHPGKKAFLADGRELEKLFLQLIPKKSELRSGLTRITSLQCPLFHVDFLSLRLLVTYHGEGTEFLPEPACDRAHLGCGRNEELIRDPGQIFQARPGTVVLMKGESFPGNSGFGAVHRSPHPKAPRVVLRMDVA